MEATLQSGSKTVSSWIPVGLKISRKSSPAEENGRKFLLIDLVNCKLLVKVHVQEILVEVRQVRMKLDRVERKGRKSRGLTY